MSSDKNESEQYGIETLAVRAWEVATYSPLVPGAHVTRSVAVDE